MPDVDLIVIGSGMAGINAAGRAAEAGLRVAVVERGRIGGTCALRGCIPSKALIRSAEVAHEARGAGAFGVRVGPVEIDMGAVADRIRAIVDMGEAGARSYLDSMETVRVVEGEASFVARGEVAVDGERLSGRRVLIATGNEPVDPPIPGLAEVPHLDSTSALALRELPQRLLVLGAARWAWSWARRSPAWARG